MIIRDRVAQTTTSSGTGDIVLAGQLDGFLSFVGADIPTDVPFPVLVKDGDAFEIFESKLIEAGAKLFRGDLIRSSTGARVALTDGTTKRVYLVAPAEAYGGMSGRSNYAATGGDAPDFTAVFPVPIRKFAAGTRVRVRFHAAGEGADSFAPDGIDPKPIKTGWPLRATVAGEIAEDAEVDLVASEAADCWIAIGLPPRGPKVIADDEYAVVAGDAGGFLVFTSATAVAITLPEATGDFAEPFAIDYIVAGAGAVTFTPATSTISWPGGDAAASLTAVKGQGGRLFTDGENYRSTQAGLSAWSLPVINKTADYTVLAGDLGQEINFTTAGVTLTLLDPATCADATLTIRNSAASGDVTLGSYNVDGIASRKVRPGRCNVLRSDGTAWRTVAGAYYFETSGQTVTFGGNLTVAHGLGARPDQVMVLLVCATAENNYAVGDSIIYWTSANNVAAQGIHARIDDTNIVLNQASAMAVLDKSTHSYAGITPAKWRWAIVASVNK
jgi:hypothetical protein